MTFSRLIFTGLAALLLAQPALAQQKIIANFDIAKDQSTGPICIPLSVPEEFAKVVHVTVLHPVPGAGTQLEPGQLTQPGLMTEHIQPSGKGLVRRDLHFMGGPGSWSVRDDSGAAPPKHVFSWKDQKGEWSELSLDKTPVMRYIYKAYDNSSQEARDKTYKPFHHLYDFEGKRFLTNGGNTNDPLPSDPKKLLYPHHRGLMYAFNKITYGGNKPCDTWHAKPGDTHEEHTAFLLTEAGSVLGRHRVAIDWHGEKNDVFAKEEREMTVYRFGKGVMVDFASRLKTVGPPVKLDGDPQHAGFQFRAHNDVELTTKDKTWYLRPDGKGDPGKKGERNWDPKTGKGPIDLGWDVLNFGLAGKRYAVEYMDHPDNPHPSRWSERDYGRFGCYFEAEVTKDRPLLVHYRVWLQEGEMTADEAMALSRAFAEPVKVKVSP
jgi:hypothetical protein